MTPETTSNVRACIEDAGGRAEVARFFNISHWAVNKWYHSGRVPDKRVRPLTGRANRRLRKKKWAPAKLRPDLAAVFGK